mmetsp:Transcript_31916/g.30425  ORF Transcript_31916/g.30425 Transcript_31916/m.30425 type:complete len:183 (+) Transcript_31916:43-591(+)
MAIPNFTDCFRKRACCLTKAKKAITIAWLISLVLVLGTFIVACIATYQLSKGGESSSIHASFAAIWTCIILILLSVLGTVIMRRFQAAISIGFFLGLVFVMSNQMLIVFAIFADRGYQDSTQRAMAVFSFFLFLVYGFFGSVLAIFRKDFIKQEKIDNGAEDETAYDDKEQITLTLPLATDE